MGLQTAQEVGRDRGRKEEVLVGRRRQEAGGRRQEAGGEEERRQEGEDRKEKKDGEEEHYDIWSGRRVSRGWRWSSRTARGGEEEEEEVEGKEEECHCSRWGLSSSQPQDVSSVLVSQRSR